MAWKNTISWVIFLLFLFGLIFFIENIYTNQRCKNVEIQLDTKEEGYFLTKSEIINLLTENGNKPILGTKFTFLNLSSLEKNILKNRLVKSCQISKTIGNSLIVKVQQKNPIARIVPLNKSSETFEGLYLDEEGGLFPLSRNFTKRVVLLSGKYLVGKHNLRSKKDKNLVQFIKKIDTDPFWKANITHILIDTDQNISFLPLVGNFTFEYGIPLEEDFEPKMKKIKIFYKEINTFNAEKYQLVSVKYRNQIVCQLKISQTDNIE